MDSIPIIDFSDSDREKNAKLLVKAFETVGFVYLDNVPGYSNVLEGRLLDACKWFFSLPLEEKLKLSPKKWNSEAQGVYRGYVPISVENNHLREQYEMGGDLPIDDSDRTSGNPLYEPTAWPTGPEGESFHKLMMSYYSIVLGTGMEFLRLTAKGLGLEETTFDDRFLPKSVSSLRIMHYPTYGNTPKPTFTCEEHFDSTFVTLLMTFSYSGLEIQDESNDWVKVSPRPGSLIVNIGEMLSRMTNRRFKVTKHRVRDIGGDRYSLPFFFEPRFDSKFEFPDNLGSSITYGPWEIQMLQKYKYQFAHLPNYPQLL